MQTPIRYYITKADDQPVVRSIPVAVRGAEATEQRPAAAVQTMLVPASSTRPDGRTRVRRLVRSAMGR